MTDPFDIAPGERETVRIFALDLPKPDIADAAGLLGVSALDPKHLELFPADDLKGVGLASYVSDGLGVAAPDVAPDSGTLDAATGYILVVHAGAFGGGAARLAPGPAVQLLGAYRLAGTAPPAITPAIPPGDTPADAPADPVPDMPARLPRAIALISLLTVAGLVLLVAYLIGAAAE